MALVSSNNGANHTAPSRAASSATTAMTPARKVKSMPSLPTSSAARSSSLAISSYKRKRSERDLSVLNSSPSNNSIKDQTVQSPADFVLAAFSSNGCDPHGLSDLMPSFAPTRAMLDGYQLDKVQLIRDENLPKLRQLVAQGERLDCCNQFGESLLHMACRRGAFSLVQFLVVEARVPLLCQDDFGRNPAHDACWTVTPQFDMLDLILEERPELLALRDVRGHTPLHYIRRDHWPQWHDYLSVRQHKLAALSAARTIG